MHRRPRPWVSVARRTSDAPDGPGERARRRLAYAAEREPGLVDVPDLPFLVLPGRGDPGLDGARGGPAHSLRRFSRAVRFVLEQGPPHIRPRGAAPLEIVGWRRPGREPRPLRTTRWLLLMVQPDEVDHVAVDRGRDRVRLTLPAEHVAAVRLVRFAEGLSAQVLHVGIADDVAAATRELGEFVLRQGLLPRGRQHLVLLRDRGRSEDRRRTIVRQPVRPATDDAD